MKTILKKIYSHKISIGIIALLIALIITILVVNTRNFENLYPTTMTVVEIDEITDTVTMVDANGSLWQIKGIEDWQIDDVCSIIMNSEGTEQIKDDTIESVRFTNHIS